VEERYDQDLNLGPQDHELSAIATEISCHPMYHRFHSKHILWLLGSPPDSEINLTYTNEDVKICISGLSRFIV